MAKTRWIPPVVLCVLLFFISHEFIYGVEEKSLFVYDLFWLKDFLCKPSGILSCCSMFFIQFLHIPWLGTLIWIILLILSAELTRIVYRIPVSLSALAYIPAAIFVSYNMSVGYAIYLITLQGFFFIPVLGYLWALLTVVVLRKFRNPVRLAILFVIWSTHSSVLWPPAWTPCFQTAASHAAWLHWPAQSYRCCLHRLHSWEPPHTISQTDG